MKTVYESPAIKVVMVEIEEGVASSGSVKKANTKGAAQPDSCKTKIIVPPYEEGESYKF